MAKRKGREGKVRVRQRERIREGREGGGVK